MAKKINVLNNTALLVIVLSLVAIGAHFYRLSTSTSTSASTIDLSSSSSTPIIIDVQPNFSKQASHDLRRGEAISPLFNDGPERKNPYVQNTNFNSGFPFSVSTQGETPYSIIGFLNRPKTDTEDAVRLPLYGRPIHYGSNQWDYYVKNGDRDSISIPLDTNNNKELIDGDTTSVQTYEGLFTTNLYDVQTPRYIPTVF